MATGKGIAIGKGETAPWKSACFTPQSCQKPRTLHRNHLSVRAIYQKWRLFLIDHTSHNIAFVCCFNAFSIANRHVPVNQRATGSDWKAMLPASLAECDLLPVPFPMPSHLRGWANHLIGLSHAFCLISLAKVRKKGENAKLSALFYEQQWSGTNMYVKWQTKFCSSEWPNRAVCIPIKTIISINLKKVYDTIWQMC